MTTPTIEDQRVVSLEEFNTTIMWLIRTEARTQFLYLLLQEKIPSYGVTIDDPKRNILKISYIDFTKPKDYPPDSDILQASFYREEDPDEEPYVTVSFSVEIPDPDTTAVNIRRIVKSTLPQQTE